MDRSGRATHAGGAIVGNASSMPEVFLLEHVSPATRLLEKRRQMFEVQEALEAQKEEFARREEVFCRREEGLRKKDLELQESLIKFNKFLQENENKRNRAIKRLADERKQREQRELEIQKLQKQYAEKVNEETQLKDALEANKRYHDFLSQVVEAETEDYPEVTDLLNRYKTLKDANRDLVEGQTKNDAENEDLRDEFTVYTKVRSDEIMNKNNEVKKLQKAHELSVRDVFQQQNEMDARIRNRSDCTLEMGQVLSAVANILERCELGSHIKRSSSHKASEQSGMNGKGPKTIGDLEMEGKLAMDRLEEIANSMMDYIEIVEEYIEAQRQLKRLEHNT